MQPKLDLSLIVAMTPERVIGYRGNLPWHLPNDLARFKRITTEIGVVVMGYNTYASILTRNRAPLPGRRTIVMTSKPLARTGLIEPVASIDEAFTAIGAYGGRACVCGGAQIYTLFLPHVRKAYITFVHAPVKGDALFPDMWKELWRCSELTPKRHHIGDQHPTSYEVLERRADGWYHQFE